MDNKRRFRDTVIFQSRVELTDVVGAPKFDYQHFYTTKAKVEDQGGTESFESGYGEMANSSILIYIRKPFKRKITPSLRVVVKNLVYDVTRVEGEDQVPPFYQKIYADTNQEATAALNKWVLANGVFESDGLFLSEGLFN